MGTTPFTPAVVSPAAWRAARIELLEKEKELTRLRDAVNTARRELPAVEITKPYTFTGEDGPATLVELFESRRQLIVYHFMFDPEWDEGCPSCSFIADNLGHLSHLHARDTTLALVSRAPLDKLLAYRKRMGWSVPWYSSFGSDFNYDFHVTIDPDVAPVEYNYRDVEQLERDNVDWKGWVGEQPGESAFLRDGARVLHTWSGYARQGDLLLNTYNWLDLTVLGRQESWEQPSGRGDDPFMSWLRRHDQYEASQLGR